MYSIAVESSPLGSLHDHLRGRGLMEMGSTNIHYVLLQVIYSNILVIFEVELVIFEVKLVISLTGSSNLF